MKYFYRVKVLNNLYYKMPPLLYDDSDVSADPRKQDKNKEKKLLENYDNNEVHMCLKLYKIKELVNKRSKSASSKKRISKDDDDEDTD